ncbi:HAMP domain-containing sensor histidine kinase [Shewanella algae]|uniref:sensor histidine kinase n=1 Tax=Shewanella algae TaxID=38313 RepID=UPI0031F5D40A
MSKYLINILESDLFTTPWPTLIGKYFIDGSKVKINATCKSCSNKECAKSNSLKYICHEGLVSYSKVTGETKITVFGFSENSHSKKNKLKSFPLESYNQWVAKVVSLNDLIEAESLKRTSETLHLFHDPVKWAEQIKISSEKLIERIPGKTFKEKFNGASSEIKAIYKSSKLLTDSFNMLEVYFNPESASFGKSTKTNVYRLFDKVQAIIYFSEGKSRNKRFLLKGTSHREIFLYESFPIIALSLVHNALKYSQGRDIEIDINDTDRGVEVHVSSIGPVMLDDEIEKIFDKGFRGKHAKNLHHDGMGIGLYVASCVAKKHGFDIKAKSDPLNYANNNIEMAENKFSFEVQSNGV